MNKMPEVPRLPLGLTHEELQYCSDDAENDPPDVPFPVSMALAIERALVNKGMRPDPWTQLFLDHFHHLKDHADGMAQAMAVLLDRCAEHGLEHRDLAPVLEGYLDCYEDQ